MKRSLLLVVAVSLAFGACQKKNETTEDISPAVETTPAPAPAATPMDSTMTTTTTTTTATTTTTK